MNTRTDNAIVLREQSPDLESERLTVLRQLMAGIAHEVNNTISVVIGQTTLLRKATPDRRLAERAEKIARAAERCARLVRNGLSLAREQSSDRHEVELNQVVREALELVVYPLQVDRVEVRLDLARNLPVLSADPHQLLQLVVTLLMHAHQAMRAAPPPRWVTVTTRSSPLKESVFLEVAHGGPGILAAGPGERASLRLSLCQGIVEGHHGFMEAETSPGGGRRFVIELPLMASRIAEAEVESSL